MCSTGMAAVRGIGLQPPADLQAIHFGQLDGENGQRGLLFGRQAQGLGSVGRFDDLESRPAQEFVAGAAGGGCQRRWKG